MDANMDDAMREMIARRHDLCLNMEATYRQEGVMLSQNDCIRHCNAMTKDTDLDYPALFIGASFC